MKFHGLKPPSSRKNWGLTLKKHENTVLHQDLWDDPRGLKQLTDRTPHCSLSLEWLSQTCSMLPSGYVKIAIENDHL